MNPSSSLYIDLLKKVLIDSHHINTHEYYPLSIVPPNWKTAFLYPVDKVLRKRNFAVTKLKYVQEEKRLNGYDWPAQAFTMIGMGRLNNIESCIRSIIQDNIQGDLIETGVWRGGAVILMRAILKEMNITHRKVWVADSFEGLPPPQTHLYPADQNNTLHQLSIFKVSLEEVQNNFKKFDLLDEQVEFLPGWFRETLPAAPIEHLALLRLDGDMYGSTIESLVHLYPKLSVGGLIIVDDYHAFDNCKKAVDDYRNKHHITTPIIQIDKEAVFWRKE